MKTLKPLRPLKDGVIADFDASEQMISMFIKNIPALKKKFFTPALRMVILYSIWNYRSRNACGKRKCRTC